MWEWIHAYLTFTRKERIGVLVLLVIILVLFVMPYFLQPKPGSKDPPAYEKYKDGIRQFESSQAENSNKEDRIPGYNRSDSPISSADQENPERKNNLPGASSNNSDPYPEQSNYPSGENISAGEIKTRAALFYFDPNRISSADWRRLGLRDKLIQTIEHYVQKGGSFRSVSDLKKLYGLRAEDFERLSPYVRIREPPVNFRQQGRSIKPGWDKIRLNAPQYVFRRSPYYQSDRDYKSRDNHEMDSPSAPGYSLHSSEYIASGSERKKLEDIDINQADSIIWCRLPGIGIKLASRIIHFRDKLGGFYSVDQLRETFGLPDSTFQKIRPFLHTGTMELQKINLNSSKQETLQEHPYIRWKLARMIIQYREQHGGFKMVNELQQIAQMDPEKFKKLEPYLELK